MPRLLAILIFLLMSSLPLRSMECTVYFGTYTRDGRSKGIYSSLLRVEGGRPVLSQPALAAAASNPSFLAYEAKRRLVIATGDLPAGQGKVEGCVLVFSENRGADGLMTLLGATRTGAPGAPCHVVLSHDAKAILAAHYNEGFVSSLRLLPDGVPGPVVSRFDHTGKTGPNRQRQERAHAHSFTISPDDRFAYACDLGLDQTMGYALDSTSGRLERSPEATASSTPGFGPRHAKFSPDGAHFYVLNELRGTVDAFAWQAANGKLGHLQTISSLPSDYSGENTSAELQIHPSGRFLYASNRGPDTIAVYARDAATGRLSLLQHVSSGGKHPRHFALSPDGAFLLCANRDTNNAVLFRIDPDKGTLEQTDQSISVPSPVCVLFVP